MLYYHKLRDSWNYMPPILVPFSARSIVTQILVIVKQNGRIDFILKGFVCDIIRPNKSQQSHPSHAKLATEAQE